MTIASALKYSFVVRQDFIFSHSYSIYIGRGIVLGDFLAEHVLQLGGRARVWPY